MDKAQAIHAFWSGFGLPAYDQNTVPDGAQMPYITYDVSTGALDDFMSLTGSVWYKSPSWAAISAKVEEIAQAVGEHGFLLKKINGGYLRISRGTPFSQRIGDEDDTIRRIYIVLNAEFLTAF